MTAVEGSELHQGIEGGNGLQFWHSELAGSFRQQREARDCGEFPHDIATACLVSSCRPGYQYALLRIVTPVGESLNCFRCGLSLRRSRNSDWFGQDAAKEDVQARIVLGCNRLRFQWFAHPGIDVHRAWQGVAGQKACLNRGAYQSP